jgi:hypothetical protein
MRKRIAFGMLLAIVLLPTAASAQQTESQFKSSTTGVALGLLLPGGGQMYSGKFGKGVAVLSITFASLLAADKAGCTSDCPGGLERSVAFPLAILGLSTWIYGMATTPADVRVYNAELAQRSAATPMLWHLEGRTVVGFALHF